MWPYLCIGLLIPGAGLLAYIFQTKDENCDDQVRLYQFLIHLNYVSLGIVLLAERFSIWSGWLILILLYFLFLSPLSSVAIILKLMNHDKHKILYIKSLHSSLAYSCCYAMMIIYFILLF